MYCTIHSKDSQGAHDINASRILTATTGINKTTRLRWYRHVARCADFVLAGVLALTVYLDMNSEDSQNIVLLLLASATFICINLVMSGVLRWLRYIDRNKR